MPRRARQKSTTGYYHVITRGVNRAVIFEDEADYQKYISFLKKHLSETDIILIAYCLMNNHVHLLVRDPDGQLSAFMQKLGISYAQYFNTRHERTGHLFQGRFRSQNIEDEKYLLTVYRYILMNPEKAGIAAAETYSWSSYHDYYAEDTLTDPSIIKSLIGRDEKLRDFLNRNDKDDECLRFECEGNDDDWIANVVETVLQNKKLKALSSAERNKSLQDLLEAGLSVRQIEQITGINRGIVQRLSKRVK